MAKILDESFERPAEESVLVQSRTLTAETPRSRPPSRTSSRASRPFPARPNIRNPLEPANADQISADGRSALVPFDIRGDPDEAAGQDRPGRRRGRRGEGRPPRPLRRGFGEATADKEIMEAVGKDLERAGLLSLPVTIVVLVVAFGALVAAGIPLLLALTAVIATMGLLALPSQVWPVDENVSAVVLLIGLAVGVDYSLFYLKREREERPPGGASAPRSRPPRRRPGGRCSSPA